MKTQATPAKNANTEAIKARVEQMGYNVIELFGGDYLPKGYVYLAGWYYTNKPKSTRIA
jgi:hypothetical protein